MTDRHLTPEIYGDFGLFLEDMGFNRKRAQEPRTEVQEPTPEEPKADPNGWHQRGEECPF